MWLFFLLFTAILMNAPVLAQDRPPSSSDSDGSPVVDARPEELPASLDRIRDALAKAPSKPLLDTLKKPPDFSVTIEQPFAVERFFRPEHFKAGPVPAGGLYGYQQQQLLWNSVDHPLAQPYAAFSGGELLTIAIENLLGKYLGGRLFQAVTTAEDAAAAAAAHAEVMRAITEYCAARPNGGVGIRICERQASQ